MGAIEKRRTTLARLRTYAGPVFRVGVFVACLVLGLSLLLIHRARAQLEEAMLALGPEMLRFDDAERVDEPRSLVLNGERIRFASGTTRHAVAKVLDYYESKCRESGGGLEEQYRAVMSDRLGVPEADASMLDPVLRQDDGERGFVACLDLGRQSIGAHALLARFQRFAKSMDLSDVGDMRYVFAEKSGEGTHFVAFWSDGSLDVGRMFPTKGDAPGKDVDGVVRPPASRRVVSTWEEGQPQGMTVYATAKHDAGSLERFYRRELAREGWTLLVDDRVHNPAPMLVAEKGSRAVTLLFGTGPEEQGTVTMLGSP